ncbi:DUF3964 family protein [Bacillus pacificus]
MKKNCNVVERVFHSYDKTRANFTIAFFENKRDLAEQVLKMEREEHVYLPDQFEIKQVPPYSFGEKTSNHWPYSRILFRKCW